MRRAPHWAAMALAWAGMGLATQALAQGAALPVTEGATPGAATAAAAGAAQTGARFLEACNQALERGVTDLGCQGPIYRNELERLKQEALTTQNPQLLSFVGQAYDNSRSGMGDVGQAYRWYLLAAVRGDVRAMQRLSELNRKGQGVPQDKVKALGYARLAERLGAPGLANAAHTTQAIQQLGADMAAEEVALAERFAAELGEQVRRQSPGGAGAAAATGMGAAPAPTPAAAVPLAVRPGTGLPGLGLPADPQAMPGSAPGTTPAAPAPSLPGARLPGLPSTR